MAESGIFLLPLTPDAVKSTWVHSETNVAIGLQHQGAIRFIPLDVKPAAVPPLWQVYQWIPFQSGYKAGLKRLLQELQPDQMAQLAGLYPQLQQAIGHREWQLAQTLGTQITALYPDYRETEELTALARREEALEQAQRAEAAQLYQRLHTAITAADWLTALALVKQIETLVPNYRDVAQLAQRARRGQHHQRAQQWQSQLGKLSLLLRRISPWAWSGGVAASVLALFLFYQLAGGGTGDRPTATPTMTQPAISHVTPGTPAPPAATATRTPSPTPRPTTTPSPNPSPTQTQVPNVPPQPGDPWTRPIDGMVMVYVPAPAGPLALQSGVAPQEGYWIDKYEVSNAQYLLCVVAGDCEPPPYANDNRFNGADYPVVGVSWFDAAAYSAWVGGALPTEGEWEYAAAGEAGTAYPWGNEFDGTRLNFCDVHCAQSWKDEAWDDSYAYTAPVDSYPRGESWMGAADMAGNVWEWTSSWYDEAQTRRVLRGGSWFNLQLSARGLPLRQPS